MEPEAEHSKTHPVQVLVCVLMLHNQGAARDRFVLPVHQHWVGVKVPSTLSRATKMAAAPGRTTSPSSPRAAPFPPCPARPTALVWKMAAYAEMLPKEWLVYLVSTRAATFRNWPFTEGCACTPERVSLPGGRWGSGGCGGVRAALTALAVPADGGGGLRALPQREQPRRGAVLLLPQGAGGLGARRRPAVSGGARPGRGRERAAAGAVTNRSALFFQGGTQKALRGLRFCRSSERSL